MDVVQSMGHGRDGIGRFHLERPPRDSSQTLIDRTAAARYKRDIQNDRVIVWARVGVPSPLPVRKRPLQLECDLLLST